MKLTEITVTEIISLNYLYANKQNFNTSPFPLPRLLYEWLSNSCRVSFLRGGFLAYKLFDLNTVVLPEDQVISISGPELSQFIPKHDIIELRHFNPQEKAHLVSQISKREVKWELQADFCQLLPSEHQPVLECSLNAIQFSNTNK